MSYNTFVYFHRLSFPLGRCHNNKVLHFCHIKTDFNKIGISVLVDYMSVEFARIVRLQRTVKVTQYPITQ